MAEPRVLLFQQAILSTEQPASPSPSSSIVFRSSSGRKGDFSLNHCSQSPRIGFECFWVTCLSSKWYSVSPTQAMWTESGGMLVSQGELCAVCYQQKGRVGVRQASNGFCHSKKKERFCFLKTPKYGITHLMYLMPWRM